MIKKFFQMLRDKLYDWLIYEPPSTDTHPYDFNRLRYEIRPGDVLLISGRSRISSVISSITQSPWTHAALYIGRIVDFDDKTIQNKILQYINAKDTTRLIIEDMLDHGTTISRLRIYSTHHIRICRPIGITPADIQLVILYAMKALGQPYNVRHLFDLARFLLPWSVFPRRWGSSLFRTSTGEPESGICSSLIAEAFSSVQFPIMPFVKSSVDEGGGEEDSIEVIPRNPYLFTPKDFDYSPYFEIIKYPFFNPDEPMPYYRRLPWAKRGVVHQDHGIVSMPTAKNAKKTAVVNDNKKHDHAHNTLSTVSTVTEAQNKGDNKNKLSGDKVGPAQLKQDGENQNDVKNDANKNDDEMRDD